MQKFIVVCLCVMLLAGVSSADIRYKMSGPWEQLSVDNGEGGTTAGWQSTAVPNGADVIQVNWGDNTVTLDYAAPTITMFKIGVNEPGTVHILDGGILSADRGKVGNNGAVTGTVNIDAGGTLTTAGWTMVGGSTDIEGILNVSGTVNVGGHLWTSTKAGSSSTIDINAGGVINVSGIIGLGSSDFNTGGEMSTLNINNGGTLALTNIHGTTGTSTMNGSVINLYGTGKITLPGDFENVINAYAAAGHIYGNDIAGNVEATYNAGTSETTVVAIDSLDPIPANGGTVDPNSNLVLSWTNMDPNYPELPEVIYPYVTVWFGTLEPGATEPNKLGSLYNSYVIPNAEFVDPDGRQTLSGFNATDDGGEYYWEVQLMGSNNPDPNGPLYSFIVDGDQPPEYVTIDTPDKIAWPGATIDLASTVHGDTGASGLVHAWSGFGVAFSADNIENPTITIDSVAVREIQADGDDSEEHLNTDDANGDGPVPGTVELGSNDLELGSEGNNGRDWQVIAVQYDTLSIPKLSTITGAKITFQVDNSGSARDNQDYTIYAEAIDDAAVFTEDPCDITSRALSTAEVTWNSVPDNPAVGTKIDTPDLTALIQEIIDRPGWSADNRLTLMIYPDAYLDGMDPQTQVQEIEFEAGPGSDSATLQIAYIPPAGSPPNSGSPSTVTLTLAVNDLDNPEVVVEDTMTIDIYDDGCDAAKATSDSVPVGDFDGNCNVELADLAVMAGQWLVPYALENPIALP